jgi:serine/threonine protein kinase
LRQSARSRQKRTLNAAVKIGNFLKVSLFIVVIFDLIAFVFFCVPHSKSSIQSSFKKFDTALPISAMLRSFTAHQGSLPDYDLGRDLGAGSIAKVKFATRQATGEAVAVKIIKRRLFKDHPGLENKVYREISLMGLMDHPHILKLIDL